MPKTPLARRLYALVVAALVLVISRNLYRRYLDHALVRAVAAGDVRAVRALLDRGADHNVPFTDAQGQRSDGHLVSFALSRFAVTRDIRSQEEVACLLIERGANIRLPPATATSYLETACDYAGVRLLRCLLEHGADPRPADGRRDTPLKYAINYGLAAPYSLRGGFQRFMLLEDRPRRLAVSREMVALLLAHGAQPTPLDAVQLEDTVLLRAVLEAGANVNPQEPFGQTPLFAAAAKGNLPLMRILLTHGANVNLKDSTGRVALNAAAGDNNGGGVEAVRLLLAQGANVNACGDFADPPLVTALSSRRADIARLLLAQGAAPGLRRANDTGGVCALTAATENLPELVPELLARGVNINDSEGMPLKAAIRAHRPAMARFLLARGAKPYPARSRSVSQRVMPLNSMAPGYAGPRPGYITTPSTLRVAVTDGPECFELLMQAGADIGPDKPDILLAAARTGHAALFDRLLGLGADVNGEDRQGKTPLIQAISHAPDGVATLLEHGANPNAVTHVGQTPLIVAAQKGDVNAVRLLLAHGADVNFKSPRAHTALYAARLHPDAVIVRLLEQAGAKDE